MTKNLSSPISRPRASGKKCRLTTTHIITGLFGGVVLIHAILFWRTSSRVDYHVEPVTEDSTGRSIHTTLAEKDKIIPFVVSMTKCGEDPFMEGAAILKYSIHKNSARGNMGGRYDYQMYAIYHPDAEECAMKLKDLGYILIRRPTPVKVEEIQGEVLRTRIETNGCCGEKELIKLEALTLTQYEVVVHLDMDVILLKPIDVLFDIMTDKRGDTVKYKQMLGSDSLMWPNRTLPERIDAFFTRDVGIVKYARKIKPVQGGFLVMRPSMKIYHELVDIVRKGSFEEKRGWVDGDNSTGLFYGCMTIQGLLPFYFDIIRRGKGVVDLNRCIYNQMSDAPRAKSLKDPSTPGKCFSGEDICEDCRLRPIEDLKSAHFTICQKPWHCMSHDKDDIDHWLCHKIHHEWFNLRSELEENWGRNKTGPGKWKPQVFNGFCTSYGKKGYMKISEHPFLPTFKAL